MTRRRGPVLLAILVAFGLRMIHLGSVPLWYDEAFAVLYASLTPAQMIYGTLTPVEGAGAADVHPLLYYFLLHGWMGLVGRSPLAVRFLSVGFGMVTVVLLGRLADWCFDRRTGLAVGLLATANPFHVAYSQEARMYALLGLAAVTAAYGLLRALQVEEMGKRRETAGNWQRSRPPFSVCHLLIRPWHWWALYAIGASLTLYAHNLGAFVLLSLHLLAVARRRWWRRLPVLVLADLVVLTLFGPWLVGVLPGQMGFVGRGYWLAPPGAEAIIRAIMVPVLTFYELPPAWLLIVGLFTSVLLLVVLVLRPGDFALGLAGSFCCVGFQSSLMLVSCRQPVYLERALLPSALFYLCAVGWLLVQGKLPQYLDLGLIVLLAVTIVGSLAAHYTYARFPRPSFDRMNALIRSRMAPGDVVVHDNKLTFFPSRHYDPLLPQTFCSDLPGMGLDTLALPTQEALGLFPTPIDQAVADGGKGVWYVAFDRTWEEYRVLGYADAPNRAWLRAHCRQEGPAQAVADLEVYHFVDCEAEP